MMLGTADHNRPLYVTAESDEMIISRILIDPGSSINLISLKARRSLCLDVQHLGSDKLMVHGFNEKGQKTLGSFMLSLTFGELHTEAKFHVIDADTFFKALLGRPWLHEYGIVPSTLHQCMKYLKDGEEFRISGDIQPFAVHEATIYEDAKYFIPKKLKPSSSLEVQLSSTKTTKRPKQEGEKKQVGRKKATPTLSKAAIATKERKHVPHLGSDTDEDEVTPTKSWKACQSNCKGKKKAEYSDSDFDCESTYTSNVKCVFSRRMGNLSISDSVFVVTRVPIQHFKEITPRKVHHIEELVTLYVPPHRKRGGPGSLFYKGGEREEEANRDWFCRLVDSGELIPTRMPRFITKNIRKMLRKQINIPTSKQQLRFCLSIWYGRHPHPLRKKDIIVRRGLGFIVQKHPQKETCQAITCGEVKLDDSDDEEIYEVDTYDDQPVEAKPAPEEPEELEDGGQTATMDELKEVNLGTEEDPRPTFISSLLSEDQAEEMKELLCEFRDCFAWTYVEMPGLSPDVAVHRLAIKNDAVPVKQAPRRMRLEIEEQVIAETKKLIEAGFIREEKYADWIANIIPVKKKNGQIRICIDFRDLNKACPKDDFPLPVSELLVDNTSNYDMFSFMDGSSGYNQIKMETEDEKHTSFRTPIGIFCYTVMPFGLKNAGATYQRAMTCIFDELIHQKVECYVDDLVVKSVDRRDHLNDLRIVFERIRKYDLKMNPLKCAFGVSSGKFLGYVVRHRGIEVDPNKIKAIMEMPPPRNLRQLRSLQGQLAFIRRFISNLSGRCQPFSMLMKKDVCFKWDDECREAFDSIKRYLSNSPIFVAPILGKPLILYTAALEESLEALLAQHNEEGKENALYYISRRLIGAEIRYSPIEKH
ncbi:uncharacterized protein LOC114578513, partial [Dendrobium catenatum]|uniref:uncharacterized protein LOC114578513 n=1 Tax=Dendrobium catenatum TaxID=906689 RepID=UPI00109F9C95